MTDQQVANDLNTPYRSRGRESMSASEVYNAVDQTEWAGLSSDQQAEIWNILALGEVNPFGREATRFTAIFGGGSVTITALKAARVEAITRAQELPGVISPAKVGHVQDARA